MQHSIWPDTFTTFSDPFVLTTATPVAFVSGLIASPLLFFCLRRRRLSIALPILSVSVLAAVAVATPFSHLLGLFCALVTLVGSCIVCARIPLTSLESSHDAT